MVHLRCVRERNPRLQPILASLQNHGALALGHELDDDEGDRLAIDDVVGSNPLAPARNHVAPRPRRGIDMEEVPTLLGNLVREIPRLGCGAAGLGGLGSAHWNDPS